MLRRCAITALLVTVLASTAIATGCGDDDDGKAATDPSNTAAARDAEKAAREQVRRRIEEAGKKRKGGKKATAAERAAAARRRERQAQAQAKRDREEDEKFDREFDKGFEETPFDKLIAKLPIRKPPLYVEQYITTGRSHTVHTAVDRKRFLCRMTPAQRRSAVERYFASANKVMRDGGVDDFEQIVTVTSETTQDLPALARARRGSVTLTERGRKRDPC